MNGITSKSDLALVPILIGMAVKKFPEFQIFCTSA